MTVDISLLLHSLVIGFVSLLAVSMICAVISQRVLAANSARKIAYAREQRALAEVRSIRWGGNTVTFRR